LDQDREFTRQPIGRFEWERILRRIQVSAPSVKLVGFTMATYADSSGGRVRPGQTRLAAVMGTSISTVRRGQSELEALGMLEMLTKGRSYGRGHAGAFASEYRLSVPSDLLEAVPMLDPDEENYQAPVTGTSENNRAPVLPSSAELPVISEELPVTTEEEPVIWAEEPVTHERPPQHEHHNKDHNKEHQSLSVAEADAHASEQKQGQIEMDLPAEQPPLSKAALAKQIAEDFQDWYAIYPKHVGRGAAVNAYARARKNGATAEDLTAGATRYVKERKGEDPKFTKSPAAWLNQECWTDDPDYVSELDVEGILGKDYWTPGTPPEGLTVAEEIAWKKEQRAAHNIERLAEAKAKAAPGWKLGIDLGPWDTAFHRQGKPTTGDKMRNTIELGRRLQAQQDGIPVPRQYQWCNPPREIEAPEQESA
jgi:hypothetical protein